MYELIDGGGLDLVIKGLEDELFFLLEKVHRDFLMPYFVVDRPQSNGEDLFVFRGDEHASYARRVDVRSL